MAVTTTGNLTAELQTYYDKRFLEKLVQNFQYAQFAEDRVIPTYNGVSIVFNRYIQPIVDTTSIALTEGVNPSSLQVSAQNVSASVTEIGRVWAVSSKIAMTAIDPNLENNTDIAAKDCAGSIDQLIAQELQNIATYQSSQVIYPNAKTSIATTASSDVLTVASVRRSRAVLDAGKAMTLDDGNYASIISPATAYDLMGDTQWQNPHSYVDTSNIYSGEIGKLYGVRFVQSNNPAIASLNGGVGSAKVYDNFFLGKEAVAKISVGKGVNATGGDYGIIVKKSGPTDTSNPLNMFATFGWKKIFSSKVLQNNFVVDVRTSATYQL